MSEVRTSTHDPIVAEIRAVRDALHDEFGGNLDQIAQHIREQSQAAGDRTVTLPSHRPAHLPPAA